MTRPNLNALDLNLVAALEALLRLGGVTEAALELGITQPAMSRTLGRLRVVLDDPILVRAGRGLVPTPRARTLLGPAREALDAFERVFAPPEAFTPETATGAITIALGDEAQVAFTGAITESLWRHAPGLDLRVTPLTTASLDDCRHGRVDLVIGPDLTPLPKSANPRGGASLAFDDFVTRPLYTRRFVVVSSATTTRSALTLDDLCAAPHALFGLDSSGRGFVDDLLALHGRRRRVAATVTSFYGVAALVARTDLLAILPAEVAENSPFPLRIWDPPLALPTLPMVIAWHPHRTAEPRHRYVRESVMAAVRARAEGSRPSTG